MKTKHIIVFSIVVIFSSILFSSCEKIIEFNGEKTTPFLVMNSVLKADSTVKVHISKSRFFLDDDSAMSDINTATVKMWVNNIEQTPLQLLNNGIYYSQYKPKTGDKIKITASASSLVDISSTTIVPEPPEVISIDTIYGYETQDGYNSKMLNFDIKFKDSQNLDEYYLIYGKQKEYHHSIDTNNEESSEYDMQLFSDDVIFKNENSANFTDENAYSNNAFNIFSDALINGKEYTFRMKTNIYYDSYQQSEQKKTYKIYFQKITKDWYLYLKTISIVNNDLSMFTEPVQVYSNIQNGLGVLGASNTYVREFIIVK